MPAAARRLPGQGPGRRRSPPRSGRSNRSGSCRRLLSWSAGVRKWSSRPLPTTAGAGPALDIGYLSRNKSYINAELNTADRGRNENHLDHGAGLQRGNAQLGVRAGRDRRARPVRLGRSHARMENTRRRRRARRPRGPADRAGSPRHRAMPPDHDASRLLAARRRRHVGDQRHRDRALGHSRQIARRAGMAPARRQGAQSSAHLHASRAGRHEGRLRKQLVRSDRRARPRGHAGRLRRGQGRLHPLHSLCRADQGGRSGRPTWSAHCARRSGPMSTSWSISTGGRHRSMPRWTTSAPSSRPASCSPKSRCRPKTWQGWRTSRSARRYRSLRASAWSAAANSRRRSQRAPSTSPSPTSAIPAACSKPRRSPRLPRPPASALPRTIRSGRWPVSPRCISAYRRPTSSSRRRCRARSPGTTMS